MNLNRLFHPLGWRIALTLLLLLLLLLYSAWSNTRSAAAQSGSDPLVLAFYYPWYDESTWSSGRTSDAPTQPYASSDRGVMGRQIEQAQAAGIDAFVAAWYGPGGGNPTESNLVALLEEAAARNFHIAILLETNSPFLGGSGDTAAALQHALGVHAASPAYLRVDGRPVIFFWRTDSYGAGTWQAIRAQADPGNSSLWIADGTDTSYLSIFDGHHLYSNTWNPPADLAAVDAKFAAQVAESRERTGATRYWVATAMPGYDDTHARGGFAAGREGGAYYDRSWAAAIASKPNWVVITSFNEWMEGSQIEPSVTYGDHYLNQTARWSAQFKAGGGAPTIAAEVAPVTVEVASSAAISLDISDGADDAGRSLDLAAQFAEDDLLAPMLMVDTELLNIRSGPDASFPLVGTALQGAQMPITGARAENPGWWQVEHQGVQGWVSGEFGTTAGDLASVPVELAVTVASAASVEAVVVPTATVVLTVAVPVDGGAVIAAPLQKSRRGPVLSPRP